MGRKRVLGWPGGRIRYASDGTPTYEVRRVVQTTEGPQRHEFSTRCNTFEAAMKVLAEWEKNHAYRPGQEAPIVIKTAVLLTETLRDEYLEWSGRPKADGGKGNSVGWVANQRQHLRWWGEKLKDRDLRKVPVGDLKEALKDAPSRAQRTAVIKHFYAWLRHEKAAVQPSEDPTFGMLKVPQVNPEQWITTKAIKREDFEKVRVHMSGHHRDALELQAGTGWHVMATMRFASAGTFEVYRGNSAGVAGVVVTPEEKDGAPHRTAVSAVVLEAAKRLRAHGAFGYKLYLEAIKKACLAAGLPEDAVQPGSFRHSVATWAIENGATIQEASTFAGHKSERTMKRFYATHATAAKVPTLL